uniref:FLYWCH-type domain-containing protein n=1 Tax=Heliothis virescens TaxID=7102 RepID=A0A2A4IUI2_HELVI
MLCVNSALYAVIAASSSGLSGPSSLTKIWSGIVQWKPIKNASSNIMLQLNCSVFTDKNTLPHLKGETWPKTMCLYLIQKTTLKTSGVGGCFKDRKTVIFKMKACKELDELNAAWKSGMVGCLKLTPRIGCDVKIILLLYVPHKSMYLGVVPNDQGSIITKLLFYENCCGRTYLWYKGFWYRKYKESGTTIWWVCYKRSSLKCTGSIITDAGELVNTVPRHTHKMNLWQKAFNGLLRTTCYVVEKGRTYLYHEGYRHRINGRSGDKVWWICSQRDSKTCSGSLVSYNGYVKKKTAHTH